MIIEQVKDQDASITLLYYETILYVRLLIWKNLK